VTSEEPILSSQSRETGKFLLTPCQIGEALFHYINSSEIQLQAMTPTKLARRYLKAARGEGLSSLGSAQVNHSSEFLLLRRAGLCCAASSQSIDHALVQVRRGHFGRMARQSSGIEAIEPAGTRIVPRTFSPDGVIPNAIFPRLCERTVGDLKHADRARGRTVDFKQAP